MPTQPLNGSFVCSTAKLLTGAASPCCLAGAFSETRPGIFLRHLPTDHPLLPLLFPCARIWRHDQRSFIVWSLRVAGRSSYTFLSIYKRRAGGWSVGGILFRETNSFTWTAIKLRFNIFLRGSSAAGGATTSSQFSSVVEESNYPQPQIAGSGRWWSGNWEWISAWNTAINMHFSLIAQQSLQLKWSPGN